MKSNQCEKQHRSMTNGGRRPIAIGRNVIVVRSTKVGSFYIFVTQTMKISQFYLCACEVW